MEEGLKQLRKLFVDGISSSGVTKLYFGDVIRIFDKALETYAANMSVAPKFPCCVTNEELEHEATELPGPSEEPKALPAVEPVYNDPTNPFKQAEDILKALLNNKTQTRGKVEGTDMPIDTSEPQPNQELLDRKAAFEKEQHGANN